MRSDFGDYVPISSISLNYYSYCEYCPILSCSIPDSINGTKYGGMPVSISLHATSTRNITCRTTSLHNLRNHQSTATVRTSQPAESASMHICNVCCCMFRVFSRGLLNSLKVRVRGLGLGLSSGIRVRLGLGL